MNASSKRGGEAPSEQTLTVARGAADDKGTIVRQDRVTLAELAELLRAAQAKAVNFTHEQFAAASDAERKRLKVAPWYVCAAFNGNRRHGSSLIGCTAFVGDADQLGTTREGLLKALTDLDCSYIIATSTSHSVGGQARYRVVIPLAKPIDKATYPALWSYLNERLCGFLDPGAKDPTRLNYLPRVPKGALGHEVIAVDGRPWFDAADLAVSLLLEPPQPDEESPTPATSEIADDQLRDLRSALAHIAQLEDANPNAVWWTDVGYALLSIRETGRGLWLEFSRAAGTKDASADVEWWTRHARATPRSDFRRIFKLAQKLGWHNPGSGAGIAAATDFPVEATAAQPSGEPPKVPGLMISDKGKPLSNTLNAVRAVTVLLHGSLHFDEFRSQVMIRWPEASTARAWKDEDATRLQAQLQAYGMVTLSSKSVIDAVDLIARRHPTNVIVEWLQGLQWDGERRLSVWLHETFGTPADRYHMRVGRNMLIAMVARAMQPGCKVDEAMVLEGEQGIRKTQAFEVIGGEYFRELTARSDSKDFEQQLRGVWLGEFSELATIKRPEDIERVKQFLTCRVDHYRPTYGRSEVDMPRRIVFCGSTNREQWAHDPTGARRFNPVKVNRVDLAWLRANREQLFAEATALYKAGRTWWTYPVKDTRERQAERIVEDPWEEQIAAYLRGRREILGVQEVLEWALNISARERTHAHLSRVGATLSRLGCAIQRRRVDGRITKVWLVPAEYAAHAIASNGPNFSGTDVSDLLGDIGGAA